MGRFAFIGNKWSMAPKTTSSTGHVKTPKGAEPVFTLTESTECPPRQSFDTNAYI